MSEIWICGYCNAINSALFTLCRYCYRPRAYAAARGRKITERPN